MNSNDLLRVIIITSEWPAFPGDISGIHVLNQVSRLQALGVKVDVFRFRGNKNPIRYLKAINNFRNIDLSKYDIVHAHHGQSGIIALSRRKLPFIVTVHGSDVQGIRNRNGRISIQGRILRIISRIVAFFANEVIIVSEHLQPYLPERNYYIIPAGIDTGLFLPFSIDNARNILNLPLEKKLLMFVGNPERPEKRFWLALESKNLLKLDIPNLDLIVLNGVANELMPFYYNACDVLLITSLSEGSPAAVREALSCNLPVVSTDVGDVRQRIRGIEGCKVCDDDNPQTIANALRDVLARNQRIEGRETVLDLDERLLTQKVIQVYQDALKKNKR